MCALRLDRNSAGCGELLLEYQAIGSERNPGMVSVSEEQEQAPKLVLTMMGGGRSRPTGQLVTEQQQSLQSHTLGKIRDWTCNKMSTKTAGDRS